MNKKQISMMAEGILVGFNNKKDIVENLISLGEEWVKTSYSSSEKKSKRQLKQECRDYLFRNYDRELVSSGIISSLILSMVLRLITNWIINILLERLK